MTRSLFLSGRGRSLPHLRAGWHPIGARLREAAAFLRSFGADLRSRREHRNVLDVDAAGAIVAEATAGLATATDLAHRVETHATEALRLLATAQDPASPGGRMITPAEAAPIARLGHRTAESAHTLGEALA